MQNKSRSPSNASPTSWISFLHCKIYKVTKSYGHKFLQTVILNGCVYRSQKDFFFKQTLGNQNFNNWTWDGSLLPSIKKSTIGTSAISKGFHAIIFTRKCITVTIFFSNDLIQAGYEIDYEIVNKMKAFSMFNYIMVRKTTKRNLES